MFYESKCQVTGSGHNDRVRPNALTYWVIILCYHFKNKRYWKAPVFFASNYLITGYFDFSRYSLIPKYSSF
jgi:hypothetical protein